MIQIRGTASDLASDNGENIGDGVSSHESTASTVPLHQFSPHSGKEVSALRFLDGCATNTDIFWLFLLTLAEKGREVKLWNCEDWVCLQTIAINDGSPPLNSVAFVPPEARCDFDMRSNTIFLWDTSQRILLLLRLRKMTEAKRAFVDSIVHYWLGQPLTHFQVEPIAKAPGQSVADSGEFIINCLYTVDYLHVHYVQSVVLLYVILTLCHPCDKHFGTKTLKSSMYNVSAIITDVPQCHRCRLGL